MLLYQCGRGSIGDNAILGDVRWAGMYGAEADFVANENCKICYVFAKDFKVAPHA